ncbi:beta-N-acetylhexosaminidase [Paracoccus aminovorans]|uniref:beta-N-acetylhexosaminidase n=1 Tax=Paracoccus aminovorans TaxID=34004 RepID=A0A1I2YEM6_9RHOB|nr:beta-N-acetylhexosaminidase [Paracoccus aminovorans]CQR86623.1 beta-N-acetylhexosaminidase [Paracoccus aminovorans]SFH23807.1 beta-N-acetylhexosaminidase [Paracoccus aminovorans]
MPSATILGGIAGPDLSRAERDFFRDADPWGFILFGRNVETPDRLRRLTADLREAVGRDAPVLIDQEGGRVQRMRAPHWTDWPAPLDQAGRGERAVWLHHHLLAQELRAVGIDADCAPVLDIARPETHPFLRNRCLGTDAATVTRLGRAAADAMLAAGVLPVIKHMPGHGRAQVDSHKDLPVVEASLADLEAGDFAPFRALSDLPMAMTAHIRFTAIDQAPATASAPVIALIRERIGFDGLLMSDDIGMQALSGSLAERAAASIAAGCDLVLSCNETLPQMEAIVAAAGPMTPRAEDRGRAALALRRAPADRDIAGLRAELAALGGLAA